MAVLQVDVAGRGSQVDHHVAVGDEQIDVAEHLRDGEQDLEAVDVGEHRPRQLVGGRFDQPGDVGVDLLGPALVVGSRGGHERTHRREGRTVPREHDLGIEGFEPVEGAEVVDEAAAPQQVAVAVELDEGVGSDRRQQVIAREQPRRDRLPQRQVAGGVARRDQRLQRPTAEAQLVAVVHRDDP